MLAQQVACVMHRNCRDQTRADARRLLDIWYARRPLDMRFAGSFWVKQVTTDRWVTPMHDFGAAPMLALREEVATRCLTNENQ